MAKGLERGQAVATAERRDLFLAFLRTVGPGRACITWPWSRREGVYVHVSDNDGLIYAHRWVWVQVNGPIPAGYEVCHNCPNGDNPACVRPTHLWLGTHSQNIRDAYAKGRMHGNTTHHQSGENHYQARLTVEDVYRIRGLVKAGGNQRALAREYGVTPAAINSIVKRRTWATVPEEDTDNPFPAPAVQA